MATGLTLGEVLAMSWEEVSVAAEAKRWGEYTEWGRVRWLAAVMATIQTGKRVNPTQLLPLEFDGEGMPEVNFEPDPDRIERTMKAWGIKRKGDGRQQR